jgi:hypothetical protein
MLNSQIPGKAFAVTPSDTTQQSFASLQVGDAGTVAIEPEGRPGASVTFKVPAGGYILCRCTKVLLAGTSPGTNIIGLSA